MTSGNIHVRSSCSSSPRRASKSALRPLFWSALALFLLAPAIGFTGATEATGAEDLHLSLRGSVPAADSTVAEAPTEVRLIFSEAPQMSGTRVRLVDASEELVDTSEAIADEDDPREVYVQMDDPLADGTYSVVWRTIAQDGHAQNGTFEFTVRAGR
jgi:methionine-rich copper-binding protein CopC